MALTLSSVQCSCGKQLRILTVLRSGSGHRNPLYRRMRFTNFFLNISRLCSRSKHKFADNLLNELVDVQSISDRSRLLNKVSVIMGNSGVHDFILNGKAEKQSDWDLKDAADHFDASLARKRFPSITLGTSPHVELYDETLQASEIKSLLAPEGHKGFPSDAPPFYVEHMALELQENLDHNKVTENESHTNIKPEPPIVDSFLDSPISCILGLSKRLCNQLENCGFHTLRKLLHHFPRTYADLQNAQVGVDDGQYLISVGRVLSSRAVKASYSLSVFEVVVGCEVVHHKSKHTIYLHLKKFFRGSRFTYQPFLMSLQSKHNCGDIVCVSGKVRTMGAKDHYEIREYNIDVLKDGNNPALHPEGRPYPIYPSKGGLNPNFLRDIIARAVLALALDIDPIPKEIREEFRLLHLHDAYTGIHKPKSAEEADSARRRFIFDEFFYLQLGRLFQMLEGLDTGMEKEGLLDKYRKPVLNSLYVEDWSSLTKKFLEALPYSLTSSQLTAVSEILWDLKRPVPMNRLLQGDVGCGKTVVAFLACMEVVGSGYQAAFMVPTELLAVQHYEHLLKLLETVKDDHLKPSIALLTGSTPSKQARVIRKDLQNGDISMVIGTHSLISDNVEFSALRLAVVDEQHRFGVIQRGRFNSKLYHSSLSRIAAAFTDGSSKGDVNMAPHILAMSATPIPRTLALALYGDMSLTQITDLPPGRIPVETYIMEGNDEGFEDVYKMMLDELETGGRVYLVYPVIEQSEQLPQLRAASADFKSISDRFKGYDCGLLHGKMKSDEKDEALRRFRYGETRILLSTQVIEVGVDVPDASMMVVMNAERFGLAQLHQLRGRVGRGTRKSKCILMACTPSSFNRLKVLEKSSDGFHLANFDLVLRGPGDLLGKKQSGHLPEFPIARLEIDGNILQEAHAAALKVLGKSHDMEQFPALKAELSMRQPLCLLGD
ncbi:ATP-dependent DNA helicase homolog RECG, chloroplastic isoform X1 [Euphorbia lathyris]|uniref:ATP-dependent DNA helicase homolog RECG, chloroplastic isoform X1 n=2 Tax=Euphorbia lathyris TaxID=212925 RepID=UPI003313BF24